MKKTIKDVLLCPQVFTVVYLPWLVINMLPFVNPMPFTRVVLIVYAVWSVAVAAKSYFAGKECWVRKYMPVLMLFLAVCFVCECIQFEYGGLRSIGELCYFAICIVVLYAQHEATIDKYSAMIKRITTIIGVILTIAILISLLMFVDMYSQQIELRNGGMMTLGFSQNRLAGVFYSANVGGLFALILAWCGLSTLLLRRGDERYYCRVIISVFQIVIALAYIAVSLSRGTYLAGIAFIFVFVLLCPSKRLAQLKIWKQMALRAVCGLLMCIVSIGVVSALNTSMCRLMELRYQQKYAVESEYMDETGVEVSGEERTTDDTAGDDELQLQSGQSVVPNVRLEGNNANFVSIQEEEYESAQHSDLEQVNVNEEKDAASSILQNAQMGFDGRQEAGREDIDITNKRASIWRAHIGLLTGKNLFVGVNDPSIYYEKQTNQGVEFTHEQLVFVEWAGGNMHNGYIQVLVNCGVIAFGLLIGFLLLCFIKCVKFWMKSVNEKENDGNNRYMLFAVCVPLVVAILVDNVVETNFVMMGPSFFQALFWFVAGVCVYCVAKNQED